MTPATHFIGERLAGLQPRIAIVLGSNLGAFSDSIEQSRTIQYDDVPGFPHPTVSGHPGQLVIGYVGGIAALILEGRVHYYEGGDASVMRPVIETFAELEIESVVLTNTAGSTRNSVLPGRLMLIRDHINFSGTNPLIGESGDANLIPMTRAYDPELADCMVEAAKEEQLDLAQGVYLCNAGPMFATPAEARMAQVVGADAIGMSTVPETILARRYGLTVAGLSVITNLAADISADLPSHADSQRIGAQSVGELTRLIHAYARRLPSN